MRAAWYERNGPAAEVLTLGELPDPEPGPGEVRVRLHASGVNPSDVKARAGTTRKIAFPRVIPCSDGAGVVGHYAVQLAKWAGAEVVATVSSPAKAEHARVAGADHVIDYRAEDVVKRVRAFTGGVDRIVEVDLGVNLPVSIQILKPFGAIAAYASAGKPMPELPYQAMMRNNLTVRVVLVYTMPDPAKAQAAADIARWAREWKPRFAIAARFPLARVVDAHLTVERGEKIGHVVLTA